MTRLLPPAELQLIDSLGAGDVAAALNSAADKARDGQLEMAIVIVIDRDGLIQHHIAWLDAMEAPWSRAIAAIASVQHDLMEEGL